MCTGAVDRVLPARPLEPLHGISAPDIAVNMHGRGPQSHAVLRALQPHRLIAFWHPAVPLDGMPAWRDDEHEVRRWCRLIATALGIAADPSRLDIAVPHAPAPAAAHGATLLHPGAASPARRWPVKRWAALARAERERGRRVVITGSRDERTLALDVARAAGVPERDVLAGCIDLLALAATVAVAARVVCGDTGVAHLATAFRRPSVVLFGPTPPSRWGPPDRPIHHALWAGRRGDPHGMTPDPGLLAIRVSDVIAALRELPEPQPPAASSILSDRSSSPPTATRSRHTQGSPRTASATAPAEALRS
jgi:ADP-heptose:LPS heptosyltransferase